MKTNRTKYSYLNEFKQNVIVTIPENLKTGAIVIIKLSKVIIEVKNVYALNFSTLFDVKSGINFDGVIIGCSNWRDIKRIGNKSNTIPLDCIETILTY